MIKIILTITIIVCLSEFTLSGQGLKVELVSIEDNRGNANFSRCELKLKITGSGLAQSQFIKLDTVLRAVDDKGNQLVNDDTFGFYKGEFEDVEMKEGLIEQEIKLTNPARSAVEIKSIKGTYYLYNANLDPKAKMVIKGFTNKPNQSLLVEKYPKLDVFFIDAESYQFMQQAEKERVNKQIATLSTQDQAGAKAFVDGFFEFMKAGSGPNTVSFYVKDPGNQIFRFEFQDETGKTVKAGSQMSGGNYFSFGFRKPVTNEWQVTLLLNTPKSLVAIPFELKNIKLP